MRANTTRHVLLVGLSLAVSLLAVKPEAVFAQDPVADTAPQQKWNYEVLKKAPEKARLKPNPLANDPDAVRAGGKLYERHCAECHGMKAEGNKHAPSLLRVEVRQATPGTLFWVLTNGVVWHGMPVWSKLPEPERWQLVSFIKSVSNSPIQ